MHLPKVLDKFKLSYKNHRLVALVIAVFQVLIAHIVLFTNLLGLAHAEEMTTILRADMDDQKERQEYFDLPTNANGETMNQIRFRLASHLASITLTMLYIGTVIAAIYLFCSLGLLFGTLRNKPELMVPWFIFYMTGVAFAFATFVTALIQNTFLIETHYMKYWVACIAILMAGILLWMVVFTFYQTIRKLDRIKDMANAAIPLPAAPAPPPAPFHFRKENMYLGDGAFKHHLVDATFDHQNYVV